MLRLVNLSSMAVLLMFFSDPRPVTTSANINSTVPNRSDGLLSTINEEVLSAVITTDAAPTRRKGSFPSSLLIKARKKEIHYGTAIRDLSDKVIVPKAYGYSQIFDYTVLDEKGRPFRRGGLKAREELTLVDSNLARGHDRPSSLVPVDEEGRFSDIQALFTHTYPPLAPGSFVKYKQKVIITYKKEDYLLGIVCIEQRANEVVLSAYSRTDASCK
jgi:hypothetical protein